VTGAVLEEHVYPDGYGRRHLNRPFWTVRCDDHAGGAWVLNSGHHYSEADLPFAHDLIARHDAAEHAS
jgi:hypothetical protein